MNRGRGIPKRRLLVLAVAFLGGCSTPLQLFVSNTLPDHYAHAAPPPGFADFCVRFADQCAVPASPQTKLTLNDQTWQRLNAVNHPVNAAISPEDDQTHYGREEFWTIPSDGFGDCEDYAHTKRKDLISAGLPASAVRIAVVYSIKTALHAVLTVSTDKGDMVLDSLTDKILLWNATGFTWIEVQDPTNLMRWDSLQPADAQKRGYAAADVPSSPSSAQTPPRQAGRK